MRSVLLAAGMLFVAGCFHATSPPADDGEDDDVGSVSSLAFTSAPATGVAGATIVACWKVEGEGTIAHTAIHTDVQSRASSSSFGDYKGDAFYPGNATKAVEVDLPGTFCTSVKLPATGSALYLRAHAIDKDGVPGTLSAEERMVAVTPAEQNVATSITLLPTAAKAAANSTVVACWRVEGAGTVPHTAIHTDTTSRKATSGVTFQAYSGPAYYPDNATAQAPLAIPATFCTGVKMPEKGTLHLRAHVLDKAGVPGKLSADERAIEAVGDATAIEFAASPAFPLGQETAFATANQTVEVCWLVKGVGVIPHTAIHTDNASHAGSSATFQQYKGTAYYPGNETSAKPVEISPAGAKLCTGVKAPTKAGTLYLRAHAIDFGGAPGLLSATERSVVVLGVP